MATTVNELTGNVYFWIGESKIARFSINLYALTDCIPLFSNITDSVYTKVSIETPAFTKEFSISLPTN